MVEHKLDVTSLIVAAFRRASARQGAIYESWVKISWRLGATLPHSLFSVSVQRDGEFDIVLRCMEDDFSHAAKLEQTTDNLFLLHYQKMLSELWIGSVYEVFRLITELEHPPAGSEIAALAHDLRLLRIPLEKHQIAQDKKLAEPLHLKRFPPNDNETDNFEYSSGNPKRSHIMPSGVSHRGSCMWQVIDLGANTTFWIERREISDRILKLYGTDTATLSSALNPADATDSNASPK